MIVDGKVIDDRIHGKSREFSSSRFVLSIVSASHSLASICAPVQNEAHNRHRHSPQHPETPEVFAVTILALVDQRFV